MGESLALRWAWARSVGSEAAKVVSAVDIGRDSPWMALITTWLVEVGSPNTAGESVVYTPSGDIQVAAFASDGFIGNESCHPTVALLSTQSQQPSQL